MLRLSDRTVGIFVETLDKYGNGLPPPEDVERIAKLIWKIRPLILSALEGEISRALELSLGKFVDDRLSRVIAHVLEHAPEPEQMAEWSLGSHIGDA